MYHHVSSFKNVKFLANFVSSIPQFFSTFSFLVLRQEISLSCKVSYRLYFADCIPVA